LHYHFSHCDRTLHQLLKTFVDILLLRKGPDSLPKSWLVFYAALFASVFVSIITGEIVTAGVDPMHDVTLLLALINAVFYFLVIQVAGYPGRYLQSLSAILGVDAIITLVYLGGFVTINLFADEATTLSFVWLITGWSVAVEGHIIARAIERPWAIGIAIAVVSYILLLLTYWQLAKLP
jgi:hypothetical protein